MKAEAVSTGKRSYKQSTQIQPHTYHKVFRQPDHGMEVSKRKVVCNNSSAWKIDSTTHDANI
jgi:hypothetical protein